MALLCPRERWWCALLPADESMMCWRIIRRRYSRKKSVGSDEDEYEDSFIDDSKPEFMTSSPASSHGEDTIHVDEPRHSKGSRRRLKKMYQSSESDDFSQQQNLASHRAHVVVSESGTNDELPICTLMKDKRFESDPRFNEDEESRVVKDDARKTEVQVDANGVTTSNKNQDAYVSGEPGRLVEQQHMVGSENGIKRKKKKKLGSENGTQLNKKEKEQSKEGKPPETMIENDFFSGMGLKWANTLQIKMDTSKVGLDLSINGEEQKNLNDRGDNIAQVLLHFDGVVGADVGKSNKKRKKKKDEKCHEAKTALLCDSKDEPQQDDAKAEGNGQDMSFHCEETQKSANDDLANNLSKNVKLHSTLMCSETFSRPKRTIGAKIEVSEDAIVDGQDEIQNVPVKKHGIGKGLMRAWLVTNPNGRDFPTGINFSGRQNADVPQLSTSVSRVLQLRKKKRKQSISITRKLANKAQDMKKHFIKRLEVESVRPKIQKQPLREKCELALVGVISRECLNQISLLMDDEELELRELQAGPNPFTCSEHCAAKGKYGCSLCKDLLPRFPPNSVRMKQPFATQPWDSSQETEKKLFKVFHFLYTYSVPLGVCHFTLDEFAQAFHDKETLLLGKVHLELLKFLV